MAQPSSHSFSKIAVAKPVVDIDGGAALCLFAAAVALRGLTRAVLSADEMTRHAGL